jgi:transposase
MKKVIHVQVVHDRCCGLDVHKKIVVACILITLATGEVQRHIRTFSTMTAGLLALADWLDRFGVTIVAMESTGVYWQPVFNVLEAGREVMVVNAKHMKAIPGRKTDVKDSEWLADLLRHNLLKPSFIPPAPIRELRALTRYRKKLVQQRAQQINRVQKVLETANIKLASVATDVLGKSGRDMLDAIIKGEQDPETLAELARGRLRAKLPDLTLALEGRVQPHQRYLLQRLLVHIDFLDQSIDSVQREIDEQLTPFQNEVTLIQSLPITLQAGAATVIAEIGVDMSCFPSAEHLASWAGLCPGNYESAGKRKSGKTTKGNPYLREVLCEMAWILSRMKDNYLSAFYHRIARRRGGKQAIIAVAHKLLVIIYHMLKDNKPYQDRGADHFDQLDAARIERRAIQRLEQLGYRVTLAPKEMADQVLDPTTKQDADPTDQKPSRKTAKQDADPTDQKPSRKTAKQDADPTDQKPSRKTAKQDADPTDQKPSRKTAKHVALQKV